MEFNEILQKRYAVKSFSEKKIDEETIEKIKEMTRMSASSFGIQPYKIYVITDKELLTKLQAASWNQAQIGTCSHLLVFCAMKSVQERIDGYGTLMKQIGTPQENIEGFMNIVNGFIQRMSKEETLTWSTKQTYIALDVAMNGAASLGIDSCPMEGFMPEEYATILNLPENHTPVVLLPLGYANDTPRNKLRFTKEDLFTNQ